MSDSPYSPSPSSREEWIALRSKVWDAQKLARTILGRDATELTGTDMLQAIRTFAAMKEELEQLQRESRLTKQALVATQCSQNYIARRLETMADLNYVEEHSDESSSTESSSFGLHLDDEEGEIMFVSEHEDDDEEEDCHVADPDASMDDVPDPEANLEEEIMRIVPTKSQSIGVGLLSDMEQCIVEWQTTFEQLNDHHEFQVQACQADLERLHVRLDTMKALNPSGVDVADAAKRARDQLAKLVQIVEAFPSKARVEALQKELEASKLAEQKSQEELARAVLELEAVRQREQELLRRLELAETSRAQLEAMLASTPEPKRRTVPVRLLRFTRKKLQRLFRLDRSVRQRQQEEQTPVATQTVGSNTFPGFSGDIHEMGSDISASSVPMNNNNKSKLDVSIELEKLGSNEDDHLFVFDSDNDSSDGEMEKSQEDWSVMDTLDATNRQYVLLALNSQFSPSKLSPSTSTDDEDDEDDDIDLSKATATDDTVLSEGLSFATDATTNSSSGTPPSKLASKRTKDDVVAPNESKSLFSMAKSLLWL